MRPALPSKTGIVRALAWLAAPALPVAAVTLVSAVSTAAASRASGTPPASDAGAPARAFRTPAEPLARASWTSIDPLARASRTSAGVLAHESRTVYMREYAHLRYVRGNESTLGERGNASGTFKGPLSAELRISTEHVSAVFTIYPHGGSVTGKASARFIVRGHTGYYGGTLRIVHGTGIYRHASGSNIGISGTIDRYSFALTVKANGWIRY